ncbi:MAG TPA: sensor histidine kinase [Bryobacteraceae bacterium]|nr:sensor histidine kinase [Bryobacteraceae bacterium]
MSVSVIYSTVPYLWRRSLLLARACLAICGLLLYVLHPVDWSALTLAFIATYSGFAIFTLYRHLTAETQSWPPAYLLADLGFFLLCAIHPSTAGRWVAVAVWAYLLLLGALLYRWRYVAAVFFLTAVFLHIPGAGPVRGVELGILLSGALAVVLAMYKDHVHERLSAALKRSLLSRSEAEVAREQERQRIAGDFHDGPLQSFIGFQMRLEIVRKLMERDSDAALSELVQLQELGRSQITELRAFVRGMQPSEVTPQTLGVAIRESVEHFERDSGISAQVFCDDLSTLSESVALELLQIIREALNNVRKHSKASRVVLQVAAAAEGVSLTVEDDGSGFPFSGTFTLDELEVLRRGPGSIKRRVRVVGGELTLDSRPAAGSTLRIRLPIHGQ